VANEGKRNVSRLLLRPSENKAATSRVSSPGIGATGGTKDELLAKHPVLDPAQQSMPPWEQTHQQYVLVPLFKYGTEVESLAEPWLPEVICDLR